MTTHSRVKHLRYEVLMLDQTRRKLKAQDFPDQYMANALIEAFCVHARNLNEFFLEASDRYKDLLKASSFTDAAYKPPRNTKLRRALFDKINRQISHLTKKRTSVARLKIGDKHREQMFAILIGDLQRFDRHLKPHLRRKWKNSIQQLS